MSLSALYFDAVKVEDLGDEIAVSPNFICPKCRKYVNGRITDDSPRAVVSGWKVKKSLIANKEVNFNRQVSFKMPCCGAQISLYVAVHKSVDKDDLAFCFSVEPIPSDWWQTK